MSKICTDEERLQAASSPTYLENLLADKRQAIIEECARVAELTKWHNYAGDPNKVIAAAIRALKDKP